jgi:hypothetical protein
MKLLYGASADLDLPAVAPARVDGTRILTMSRAP